MRPIVVENTTFDIVTDFSEPPPIEVMLQAAPVLDVSLSSPASLQFTFVPAPIISISVGSVVGIPGPKGDTGQRGSLFLGGYPSFNNLPVPDGVNVKTGDFALVQDESAIYELE